MSITSKTFKVSVAEPCKENWNKMNEKETGRFCANCQKTVVDFSNFSDKELFNYFSTVKQIPCGRFHDSQLNTNILPGKTQANSWMKSYKSILPLLALLSMKPADASSKKKYRCHLSTFV